MAQQQSQPESGSGTEETSTPAEGEDTGVVEGGLIDEHPPVTPRLLQSTESRAQVPRTHLAGSTRAAHELRELDLDPAALGPAAALRGCAVQSSRPIATHSISTRAPRGSPATATVVRAGGLAGNSFP